MLLSLVHSSSFTSPFESKNYTSNLNPTTLLLPNSFFPDFQTQVPTNALKSLLCLCSKRRSHSKRAFTTTTTHASLLEAPVLWAGRLCIFSALLKAGLAGSQSNPLVSELENGDGGAGESGDLGFSQWLENIQGKPEEKQTNPGEARRTQAPTNTNQQHGRAQPKNPGKVQRKQVQTNPNTDQQHRQANPANPGETRREQAPTNPNTDQQHQRANPANTGEARRTQVPTNPNTDQQAGADEPRRRFHQTPTNPATPTAKHEESRRRF